LIFSVRHSLFIEIVSLAVFESPITTVFTTSGYLTWPAWSFSVYHCLHSAGATHDHHPKY
jgi:hypothetical protein